MSVRKLPYFGIVAILAVTVAGCSSMSPPAFPGDIGAIAKTVAASMADQGVWTNMAANVNGHVTNPGLRVAAGMEYYGSARFDGVSGQVGLSGQGTGTGTLSDDARSAILKILTEKPEYSIPAIPNLTSKATSGESASVAQPPGGG